MKRKIALACEECASRNYHSDKNMTTTERLVLKKFCKRCNRHTLHRETK